MTVQLSRLSVEHYRESLGIGTASPRLSWRFVGDAKDWKQAGYEVRIQRNLYGERRGDVEAYRIDGCDSLLVPWPSTPLESREAAAVAVRCLGTDDQWTNWVKLEIEAGLLQREEWIAIPITLAGLHPVDSAKRPFRVRARFKSPQHIRSVRLYITALGVYEATLNGVRIGADCLTPGWTDYNYNLNYQTYDLGSLLAPGEVNELRCWVGEGWYAGRLGWGDGRCNIWGDAPALMAQVEINGRPVLATDFGGTWTASHGALISSEIYDGETYDARLDDEVWQEDDLPGRHIVQSAPAGEGDSQWKPVRALDLPACRLVSSQSPPVRVVETIKPLEIMTTPSGKTIVDFGQVFAGVVRIEAQPPSTSSELVLRHAEVLDNGELGTRPLRCAKAVNTILLGNTSVVGYRSRFTFYGFRYVEVSGWPGLKLSDLLGLVFQSSMERTGHFECSHPLLNRLHRNVIYSTISNTISIPTDCPQRDERLGWSGDLQVFAPTLSLLYDSCGFIEAWLRDGDGVQDKLGGFIPKVIPDIFPAEKNWPFAIWCDVSTITPMDVYIASGDIDFVRGRYHAAATWLSKGVLRDPKTRLWTQHSRQLADWLHPRAPADRPGEGPTDKILVADIFLIRSTRAFAKMCRLLDRHDEARAAERDAQDLIDAFYHEYVTPSGRVATQTQTSLGLLIEHDIYPRQPQSTQPALNYREVFAKNLSELVVGDAWQVSTGFAGTPVILHALEKAGLLHHAYRMLQARECPSWLAPVLLGATTIWERWDSMLVDGTVNPGEMTSFNHYALGSVASFLYNVVGGISPIEAGWKTFRVKPQPGGTLNAAKASFLSPYGLVQCEWTIDSDKLHVTLQVPPNTSAFVELPGQQGTWVGSGVRRYSIAWTPDRRFPPPFVPRPEGPPGPHTFIP